MHYERLNEIIGVFTRHESLEDVVFQNQIIHQYLNEVLFAKFSENGLH